jgi:hypothetical protein
MHATAHSTPSYTLAETSLFPKQPQAWSRPQPTTRYRLIYTETHQPTSAHYVSSYSPDVGPRP